jgi:hypothetical protein
MTGCAPGDTAMSKYRKKPVVIEAIQLTRELALDCLVNRKPGPFGLHVSGRFHPERREVTAAYVSIRTLEGKMRGELDDWIIRGVKNELYPCKPDIFAQTYEKV